MALGVLDQRTYWWCGFSSTDHRYTKSKTPRHGCRYLVGQSQATRSYRLHPDSSGDYLSTVCSSVRRCPISLERWSYNCTFCAGWCLRGGICMFSNLATGGYNTGRCHFAANRSCGIRSMYRHRITSSHLRVLSSHMVPSYQRRFTTNLWSFAPWASSKHCGLRDPMWHWYFYVWVLCTACYCWWSCLGGWGWLAHNVAS